MGTLYWTVLGVMVAVIVVTFWLQVVGIACAGECIYVCRPCGPPGGTCCFCL